MTVDELLGMRPGDALARLDPATGTVWLERLASAPERIAPPNGTPGGRWVSFEAEGSELGRRTLRLPEGRLGRWRRMSGAALRAYAAQRRAAMAAEERAIEALEAKA
jgi:hypothetical protein